MRTALLLCLLCSALIIAPMIPRVPVSAAFMQAPVRDGARKSMELLRHDGLWLVHVRLLDVRLAKGITCFLWEHAYVSRFQRDPFEEFSICF